MLPYFLDLFVYFGIRSHAGCLKSTVRSRLKERSGCDIPNERSMRPELCAAEIWVAVQEFLLLHYHIRDIYIYVYREREGERRIEFLDDGNLSQYP